MERGPSHGHDVRLDARLSLLHSPQHLTPGALCRSLHSSHRYMFRGATSFTSDLSQWDVGKVTTMEYVSMRARLSSAHRST